MMGWRHVWWGGLSQCRARGGPPWLYHLRVGAPAQRPATSRQIRRPATRSWPGTQGGAAALYVAEPFWVAAFRRCMQQKGWSPPHWQFSSQAGRP